jgi:hypothetical protein
MICLFAKHVVTVGAMMLSMFDNKIDR